MVGDAESTLLPLGSQQSDCKKSYSMLLMLYDESTMSVSSVHNTKSHECFHIISALTQSDPDGLLICGNTQKSYILNSNLLAFIINFMIYYHFSNN